MDWPRQLAARRPSKFSGQRWQALCLALLLMTVRGIGPSIARGGVILPAAVCGNSMLEAGEECDDGNTFGGDGCASNCTKETEAPIVLDGAESMPRSHALLQAGSFSVSLGFSGSLTGRIGKPGADGIVPVAVRVGDILFNPIPVPGVACICSWPIRFDAFGPDNAGVGQIGCGAVGLSGVDADAEIDHRIGVVGTDGFTAAACLAAGGVVEDGSPNHPHAGVCNGALHTTRSGNGPQGSTVVTVYTSFDVIPDGGSCHIETSTKICEGGYGVHRQRNCL